MIAQVRLHPSSMQMTGISNSFKITGYIGSGSSAAGNTFDLRGYKVCFRSHKIDDHGTIYGRVWLIPGAAETTYVDTTVATPAETPAETPAQASITVQIQNTVLVVASDGRSDSVWRYVVGGVFLDNAAVGSDCKASYFPVNFNGTQSVVKLSDVEATGTSNKF